MTPTGGGVAAGCGVFLVANDISAATPHSMAVENAGA